MKKDLHVEIYKFAFKNANTGISYDEAYNYLATLGFATADNEIDETLNQCLKDIMGHSSFNVSDGYRATKFPVMPDAYFKYLDFIELQEARADSRRAKMDANKAQSTANRALIIAIISAIAQILISLLVWLFPRG